MNTKELSDYMRKIGRKGGKTTGSCKARSPRQASNAAKARWANTKTKGKK